MQNPKQIVKIPYSSKEDFRLFKETGLQYIEELMKEIEVDQNSEQEQSIKKSYHSRLKAFLLNTIKQAKNNVEVSRELDKLRNNKNIIYNEIDTKLIECNQQKVSQLNELVNRANNKKNKVEFKMKQVAENAVKHFVKDDSSDITLKSIKRLQLKIDNQNKNWDPESLLKDYLERQEQHMKNQLDQKQEVFNGFVDKQKQIENQFKANIDEINHLEKILKRIPENLNEKEKVFFDL